MSSLKRNINDNEIKSLYLKLEKVRHTLEMIILKLFCQNSDKRN